LSVPELTRGIVDEFSTLAGGDAEKALASFSEQFHGFQSDDFEALLSPIESVGLALTHLSGLQALGQKGPEKLEKALSEVAKFCRDVYRIGFGTALELVASAATGKGHEVHNETVVAPCKTIAELDSADPIAVATLNYDGLLHSGFLDCLGSTALDDLGAGYETNHLAPTGEPHLPCHPMRLASEFRRSSRVHLLNLHGSLAWLEDPAMESVHKFQLQSLRHLSYWSEFKAGTAAMNPVVVLTNRKQNRIREAPFSLAYSVFEERLQAADRWLIAGYAFGDEPVNAVFRRCSAARAKWGAPTRLLVLGKGGDPAAVAATVETRLGVRPEDLAMDLSGLPSSVGGDAWNVWAE